MITFSTFPTSYYGNLFFYFYLSCAMFQKIINTYFSQIMLRFLVSLTAKSVYEVHKTSD